MFAYNPTVNNQAGAILGAGQVSAAATNAQSLNDLGGNISGAIDQISSLYRKKKNADAFDSVMGAAADEGIVTYDTLEKFRNLPWQQKAAAFDLYQNTIFPIQANQQKVQAQAQAWSQYRGGKVGGSTGGSGGDPDGGFVF